MTPLLTERYAHQIRGMLHCFDRILVQGILPPLSYGRGITAYFYEHKMRIFGFTEWAKPLREAIRENAARLAAAAGVEIEVVRKKSVRKEDRVQEILQRRGSHSGLVCILAAMERCRTFQPWYDRDSQRYYFQPKEGCCLHYYFYFLDEELGLCWVRVPTWAPFRLQVYWNGHGWLASQLRKQEIGFTLVDNAFTDIADFTCAQKIADRLRVGAVYRKLGSLARRCCPVARQLGLSYQWSVDQAEYATDIIFENPSDLQSLYEPLLRSLVQVVKPRQIATFLGKKINRTYGDEVGNRYDVSRSAGARGPALPPLDQNAQDSLRPAGLGRNHVRRQSPLSEFPFGPGFRTIPRRAEEAESNLGNRAGRRTRLPRLQFLLAGRPEAVGGPDPWRILHQRPPQQKLAQSVVKP